MARKSSLELTVSLLVKAEPSCKGPELDNFTTPACLERETHLLQLLVAQEGSHTFGS